MFVVIFHSIFGLRDVELSTADRLRELGYDVVVPDLFDGATVPGDMGAGFELLERIGWAAVAGRARQALADVPQNAALLGFSMGVGVIDDQWQERRNAAAVFCLHAPVTVPEGVPAGTPVQVHAATTDPFAPDDRIAAFEDSATRAGVAASVHRYVGAGHFFTDESLPDYDAMAAELTWNRVFHTLDVVSSEG